MIFALCFIECLYCFRSESLRYILKQYGVSVENPQENKASSINFEETHADVPSTVIYDSSKMVCITEVLDLYLSFLVLEWYHLNRTVPDVL